MERVPGTFYQVIRASREPVPMHHELYEFDALAACFSQFNEAVDTPHDSPLQDLNLQALGLAGVIGRIVWVMDVCTNTCPQTHPCLDVVHQVEFCIVKESSEHPGVFQDLQTASQT